MKKKNHIITTHSFLSLNTNPVPMILTSWNPHRYNPLLFSAGGTCDLLLTNRLRQKWQAITSMLMLHKIVIVMPLFQENAPVLALRKQAVRLGKAQVAGNRGQLLANSFSPTAHKKPHAASDRGIWEAALLQLHFRWEHSPGLLLGGSLGGS